ncbi:MAG: Lrp/AsnC family transcriptional regulator [Xanthomonadales bacterium]|jgi:Lrp/AsnC family leucine-responsive transcriptional regulator|nr:Lrp/AsnC family transcriptional regulator [Xanthomonadales bacterium]
MEDTQLDRTDLRLLAILQAEGRIANTDLAERINLSASACLRRVQRLESAGVIAGYRAVLSAPALGLGLSAFVRLQLRHHDADAVRRFGEDVKHWPEVVACYALSGDTDYMIQVVVTDLAHFSRFLLDTLLASSAVADVNTSFVLKTVKADQGLPL